VKKAHRLHRIMLDERSPPVQTVPPAGAHFSTLCRAFLSRFDVYAPVSFSIDNAPARREHLCVSNVSFAMLHRDILPEHSCDGELIPMEEDRTYLHVLRCSSCGTEFAFMPDAEWVTMVLPGMRN
jgi:hypothetical protein